MNVRLVFAIIYTPLMIALGEIIHALGRKLLQHAFDSSSPVAAAIGNLLRLGWYITSAGLLLWNLGMESGEQNTLSQRWTEISLRLGIALFVVGVLHGLNILAVSLFHRKNTV